MQDLPAGTLIDGRYSVISRIGTGGMADVYLAHDSQLGRRVAVKLLNARFAEDSGFVERFRREASSAASLSHPNVVSVFDRGEWNGTYYIAMEHLTGRSLKALVRESGALAPLAAIELTLQLLRAARFAHGRGVIHRDLKPQNAIVDDEGQLKVTDFGIARAGTSEITETGSIMGTAQYLSPEQAQGRPVGERSDLYSIGIVLYELLTGSIPFDGESAVTIALKQINEVPPPPSTLNRAVSPELDAIVMRALAKQPEDRFADAQEFIHELEAEQSRLRGEPPAMPPPPLAEYGYAVPAGENLGSPQRSLWPWVVLALLLLALLAGGAYAVLHKGQRSVPNVVGRDEANATRTLQAAGFGVESDRVSVPGPAGVVIRESPAGGTNADKGSEVRIAVSSGPPPVQIPDVQGLARGAARRALHKAGFAVSVASQASATVPRGRALGTVPPAHASLPVGAQVTLQVSSGVQPVVIPNVVGRTQADGTAVLESSGFRVLVTDATSPQTPGTIVAQSPNGRAASGDEITITVAMASDRVAVPSLVGKASVDAISALAAAGLQSATTGRTVSDAKRVGVVLSQSPSAGGNVKRGSTVSLVVGQPKSAPPPTTTTTTTPAPPPTTTTTTTTTAATTTTKGH
ncbi:MAG: Stk1 family PASTA domain-containing Ser/Thr kinase [Solirubrobacteraceae bacterium]